MNIKPMLAIAVDEPFNDKKWVFEIKWDGVRCILFWKYQQIIIYLTFLDGKNLQGLDFLERRKILCHIIDENSRIKISDFIEEVGKEIFDNVKKMNLEGVVAKYKSSKYLQV